MSAATEFAPVVYIPEQARTCPPPERLAPVIALHRPSERSVAPPVRLTRRGVVVLAVASLLLALAIVAAAWLSAPSGADGSAAPTHVPATVTVHSGDTLWSIATRIAPDRDPRAEVADLQRLNSLGDGPLLPGRVLRTR